MIVETDLAALRSAVTGAVLTADDADFEAEAGGYNLAVSHRPDVIVAATSRRRCARRARSRAA